jgi:hypothetical protein
MTIVIVAPVAPLRELFPGYNLLNHRLRGCVRSAIAESHRPLSVGREVRKLYPPPP